MSIYTHYTLLDGRIAYDAVAAFAISRPHQPPRRFLARFLHSREQHTKRGEIDYATPREPPRRALISAGRAEYHGPTLPDLTIFCLLLAAACFAFHERDDYRLLPGTYAAPARHRANSMMPAIASSDIARHAGFATASRANIFVDMRYLRSVSDRVFEVADLNRSALTLCHSSSELDRQIVNAIFHAMSMSA